MKTLARNWKAVLAFILLIAALLVYTQVYAPKKEAYVSERDMIKKQITVLQTTVAENEQYKSVQSLLDAEYEKMDATREEIYTSFPDQMKEEDQLMYLLYLEETFGNDIAKLGFSKELYTELGSGTGHASFAPGSPVAQGHGHTENVFYFGQMQPIQILSDGAVLQAMDIVLSYSATYDGFKKMVDYLATDSRVVSINYATLQYDVLTSKLCGELVIRIYGLDVTDREYEVPVITDPGMGKENVFAD